MKSGVYCALNSNNGSSLILWDDGHIDFVSTGSQNINISPSGSINLNGPISLINGTAPAADNTYSLPTSITIKSGIITAIS